MIFQPSFCGVVVVVVIILIVVFFTLTDRASTIPSNIRGCQSGTWSQRGTKVNGSHHGDNPLLRPTGIQIATKVMRLYKRWHRPITKRLIKPPLLHNIESSPSRSPTHDQRSQQQIGQITVYSQIRNGLLDKESVVFRDFEGNDYRLRPFTVDV